MGGKADETTVLVVDDDASMRLLCRVNLELEGYRVVEAATIADAAEALSGGGVDVVLLDVHVGRDDGRDLLEVARERHPEVAVAFMTGTADPEDLRSTRADGILAKPFTLTDLSLLVGRLASA